MAKRTTRKKTKKQVETLTHDEEKSERGYRNGRKTEPLMNANERESSTALGGYVSLLAVCDAAIEELKQITKRSKEKNRE